MNKFLQLVKSYGLTAICLASVAVFAVDHVNLRYSIKTRLDGLDSLSKVTKERLDDVSWSHAADEYEARNNIFSPDVGVIQFLKNGYTMEIETMNYEPEGLNLAGKIGNPKNLRIVTLTLKFSARKHLGTAKDKFLKDDPYPWFFGPEELGNAQCSVGELVPGGRASFKVTIPNVKQTSEGHRLEVDFSGERYSVSSQ